MTRGFFIAAVLVACSSDDQKPAAPGRHTSPHASCQSIIDACHPYDVGEGAVHDCHDLAANGTEASCSARKADCIATCTDAGS